MTGVDLTTGQDGRQLGSIIRPGAPEMQEIRDAVLTPLRAKHMQAPKGHIARKDAFRRPNWLGGVFRPDGSVAELAMLYRGGWDRYPRIWEQEPGEFPLLKNCKSVGGKAIYGGVLTRHYAHFIYDSLSRLWALRHIGAFDHIYFHCDFPADSIDDLPNWIQEFFAALDIPEEKLKFIGDIYRVESLYVPDQGFTLNGFVYSDHLSFLESIFPGGQVSTNGDEKIYISRSRMTRRLIAGETRLEAVLRDNGFRIFHPEQHGVREQVGVIGSAKVVVGFRGAAMATLYLAPYSGGRSYVIPRLVGYESHYFPLICRKNLVYLDRKVLLAKDSNYLVDLNSVLRQLGRFGVVEHPIGIPMSELTEEYALYDAFDALVNASTTCAFGEVQVEEALQVIEKMLALRPHCASRLTSLVDRIEPDSGHIRQLIIILRAAFDAVPHDIGVTTLLCRALERSGRYHEAIEVVRRGIRDVPTRMKLLTHIARLLLKAEQFDDAERNLRPIVVLDPDNDEAHYLLGCALDGRGKYGASYRALRRAVELNPENAGAYYRLGSVAKRLRRYRQAEGAFQKAAELAPENPQAHYRLGEVLQKRRKFAQSVAAFDRALRLQPTHSGAHYRLGICQYNLRSYDAAVDSLHRAIELGSKNANARDLLAKSIRKRGRMVSDPSLPDGTAISAPLERASTSRAGMIGDR